MQSDSGSDDGTVIIEDLGDSGVDGGCDSDDGDGDGWVGWIVRIMEVVGMEVTIGCDGKGDDSYESEDCR